MESNHAFQISFSSSPNYGINEYILHSTYTPPVYSKQKIKDFIDTRNIAPCENLLQLTRKKFFLPALMNVLFYSFFIGKVKHFFRMINFPI